MIEIKLVIVALSAGLFWIGGAYWHNARRFLLPVLLTSAILFLTQWDWWCLSTLSVIGIFCLGYGEKSPLRHIFGDGWGRSVWGFLAAICLSAPLFATHHLLVWLYLPYLALNFTLENALKRIPQLIGDLIIGASLASIILMVK